MNFKSFILFILAPAIACAQVLHFVPGEKLSIGDGGIKYTAPAYDADAISYFSRAGVTSPTAKAQISDFVKGLKSMGLWSTSLFFPLRSGQNAGSGLTAYSLGGLGSPDATLTNGPVWSANGVTTDGTDDYLNATIADTRTGSLFHVCAGTAGNSTATGNAPVIVCNSAGRANGMLARFGCLNLNEFQASTVPASSTLSASATSITGGAYTFLTAVRGNTSFSVSTGDGGALVAGTAPTAIANTVTRYVIGARDDGASTSWFGTHAFSMLSTTQINSTQLAQLYALYKTTLGVGLGLP